MAEPTRYVVWLSEVSQGDVARVGGKNASLGEMIQRLAEAGVTVPDGFATTAQAYRDFLATHDLAGPIGAWLRRYERGTVPLARAGAAIRRLFLERELPPAIAGAIVAAYRELGARVGRRNPDVAVRSSATAEDLPEASFAGQQETFLNVRSERALLAACRRCLASLFTDRAIAYREAHGFDHLRVALSVGVQRMVRSDRAGAGVMFSIDTETGFPGVVLIDAVWGLGETAVQGTVDPDEYMVFKPLLRAGAPRPIVHRRLGDKARRLVYGGARGPATRLVATPVRDRRRFVLTDADVLQLARWAVIIEEHYGRPMDMEWAKDGRTGELAVVQARPETVQSRREAGALKRYTLRRKGRRLLTGLSIGDAVASGPVAKRERAEAMARFPAGAVLVTAMTDPDWVPIMRRAAAIVTDHGGRTSHAAIVSRELGLPAIVGCGQATRLLEEGQAVTVSCAEGDQGFVYAGVADVEVRDVALDDIPKTRTQVMLNVGNPAGALRWWRLPSDGVGLARIEFIIGSLVKIHPLALTRFREVTDRRARRQIEALTAGYRDKRQYFVDTLGDGIGRIAAVHYPRPVIVRMSDLKTNEYAALVGGRQFEPAEENPMLGWRGASRYASRDYQDGFALECAAIRRVRETMGLTNVIVMIPFCRTLGEADAALRALAEHGLRRGDQGLEVYVMCEIPSNVILAAEFAERFDGFSIGSNDLTQLTLGVDRDSARLAHLFDEDDPAVRRLIGDVIGAAHRAGRKIGLCGQAPSDRPAFARFLVEAGIDAISVAPDSFLDVKRHVADAERDLER